MTPEECEEIGGHCWLESDIIFYTTLTGEYHSRFCKHCLKTQKGVSQPPVKWEDL